MKNVVCGRYDTRSRRWNDGDEIGLMARDLEYFRGMMEQASAATKAAMFQSAAFQSSRARRCSSPTATSSSRSRTTPSTRS